MSQLSTNPDSAESDFLREIAEHPDDVACRLIYADWLQERGDPRGEFIRLQCALAEMTPDDPHYRELRDLEVELFSRHRSKWTGHLSTVAQCSFAGGFLHELRIDGDQLANVSRFVSEDAPLLESLRLVKGKLGGKGIRCVSKAAWSNSLTTLDASSCGLTVNDLREMVTSPYLRRLRRLDLSWNNWLGDAAIELLSLDEGLPALEELDLRNTGFGKHGMRLLTESEKLLSQRLLVINPPNRRRGFQYSMRHLEELYGKRLVVFR